MDMKVEIKEEALWFEETGNSSLDSHVNSPVDNNGVVKVELQSSIVPEVENEPLNPGSEDNVAMPVADIKDEIITEECTVNQLVPYFKEESKVTDIAVMANGASLYHHNGSKSMLSRKTGLKTHLITNSAKPAYNPTVMRTYNCSICNNTFALKGYLKKHLLTHSGERPYTCKLCDNAFALKGTLKRHLLTHSGERPYQCNTCNNTFVQKGSLERHILSHYETRPYSCSICSSSFTQKGNLLNHLSLHSGEKRYNCEICKSKFARKRNLVEHLLTHSGARPYHCSVCTKAFALKRYVKAHQQTHAIERPYSCDICNNTFSEKSSLKCHLLTHSIERPYSCKICTRAFTVKRYLKKHQLTHGEERQFLKKNTEVETIAHDPGACHQSELHNLDHHAARPAIG